MCCSVTPGVEVEFSRTVLYGAEVKIQEEIVHVLGYQNQVGKKLVPKSQVDAADNQSFSIVDKAKQVFFSFFNKYSVMTGNAMLLPFPAQPKTMTQANVLDTKNCKKVLQDISKAVTLPKEGVAVAGYARSFTPQKIQIFEAAGIYTVVLAQDARDIPSALELVPPEKRPTLNQELFEAYSKWYPDWTFALCCFNNRQVKLADPLVWWYQPMNPNQLFLPTLDSHDGTVPNLSNRVQLDHIVAVGSYRARKNPNVKPFKPLTTVNYRNQIPLEIKPYFLDQVMGREFDNSIPYLNADFVFQLEDVINEKFDPKRIAPVQN